MPDVTQLKQRYPELENADDTLIGIFIEDAKMEISQARWGRLFERGVLALSAHLYRLNQLSQLNEGGAVKAIASESAGELSVSYQAPSLTGTQADYALTAYGQEYLRLRKLVGVGLMVV